MLARQKALLAILLSCIPLSATRASAQDTPVIAFGADYTLVRANGPPGGCSCAYLQGGNAWLSFGLTRHISAVAEGSSQHANNINSTGTDLTLTSFLFGARFTVWKLGRLEPFGQVLLGGAHASGSFAPSLTSASGSANAFASVAGGGLDIGVTQHFGVRAFEADYYFTRFSNGTTDHQNNLRISAGVFARFGSR